MATNTSYTKHPKDVNNDMPLEKDPNSKSPHEPGAKLDAGKTRAALMTSGFSLALTEVAKVTTFGAAKYTPNGWLSVPYGQQRYADAHMRHILKSTHEDKDPDSGISHLAHAAWNILAILELELRRRGAIVPLETAKQI